MAMMTVRVTIRDTLEDKRKVTTCRMVMLSSLAVDCWQPAVFSLRVSKLSFLVWNVSPHTYSLPDFERKTWKNRLPAVYLLVCRLLRRRSERAQRASALACVQTSTIPFTRKKLTSAPRLRLRRRLAMSQNNSRNMRDADVTLNIPEEKTRRSNILTSAVLLSSRSPADTAVYWVVLLLAFSTLCIPRQRLGELLGF